MTSSSHLQQFCCGTGLNQSKDVHHKNLSVKTLNACNVYASDACVPGVARVQEIRARDIITNTITTLFLDLCAEYPIEGTGGSIDCFRFTPAAFCGAIHQYINSAWGIYRAPGITEVTVGAGGDNIAPGAAYPNVNLALADAVGPLTNCFFCRITDNVTEPGDVFFPGPTLLYIDPGVTYRVDGQFISDFDIVVMGSISQNSSAIIFNTVNGLTAVRGTGSVMFAHVNITNSGVGLFMNGSALTRHLHMNDVVINLGEPNTFLSDAAGPLSAKLSNITLRGTPGVGGASGAITLTNANSRVIVSHMFIEGGWTGGLVVLSSTNNRTTWSHIVNRSLGLIVVALSSDVNNIRDESGTLTLRLHTTNTRVTDAQIQTIDNTVLGVPTLFLTNIEVVNFTGGVWNFNNGHAENITVSGIGVITSQSTGSPNLDNIRIAGSWDINQPGGNCRFNNIEVSGNFTQRNGVSFMTNLTVGGNWVIGNSINACNISVRGSVTTVDSNGGQFRFSNLWVGVDMLLISNRNGGFHHFTNFFVGRDFTTHQGSWESYEHGRIVRNTTLGQLNGQHFDVHFEDVDFGNNVSVVNGNSGEKQNFTFDSCTFFRVAGALVSFDPIQIWRVQFLNCRNYQDATNPPQFGTFVLDGRDCTMDNCDFICNCTINGSGHLISNCTFKGLPLAAGAQGINQIFTFTANGCKIDGLNIGSFESASTLNPEFIPYAFGSNTTGQFAVQFAGLNNDITNLSIVPRRGDNTNFPDISGVPGAVHTIAFNSTFSRFKNINVYFQPLAQLAGDPFGHYENETVLPVVTVGVLGTSMNSSFNGINVGYSQIVPGFTLSPAVANRGRLQILGNEIVIQRAQIFDLLVDGTFLQWCDSKLLTSTTVAGLTTFNATALNAIISDVLVTPGTVITDLVPAPPAGTHPLCVCTRNLPTGAPGPAAILANNAANIGNN